MPVLSTRAAASAKALGFTSNLQQSLLWENSFGDTVTSVSNNVYTTSSANNVNGYGVFSQLLPGYSCYVDILLNKGYLDGYVNFLGVSNTSSLFQWPTQANYQAWYYSGSWYGNGTVYVGPSTNLNADAYRIAINRNNSRIYMKSTASSTIAEAALPSGSNLYIMVLPQSGYPVSGATIVNGIAYNGSGGLY